MKTRDIRREWEKILTMKRESPYVFRTRVERTLGHSLRYAKEKENEQLCSLCREMSDKIKYLSDQSNQTSDGTLNSFMILEKDMKNILTAL